MALRPGPVDQTGAARALLASVIQPAPQCGAFLLGHAAGIAQGHVMGADGCLLHPGGMGQQVSQLFQYDAGRRCLKQFKNM